MRTVFNFAVRGEKFIRLLVDHVNDIINYIAMKHEAPPKEDPFHNRDDDLHLFREIGRTHQMIVQTFSRALGMPASRFMLMKFLAKAGNGVGVTDLAAMLEVNPAAVVRLVQEMEDEHFVVRRDDPKDGRRSYISLTPKGVKLFEQLHQRSHAFERALTAFIDADEIATATRVLAKLREFMGTIPDAEIDG